MTEQSARVYTAQATAYGDGRAGHVTSDDDVLDLDLAVPKEMGGPGGDLTNPEQMFAAGYAACFHGALKRAGSQVKADLTGPRSPPRSASTAGSRARNSPSRSRSPPLRYRTSRPRRRGTGPPALPILQRNPGQHPGDRRSSPLGAVTWDTAA